MNDKRFRQAVGYAVDRAFIRDNIFGGLGRIASGPINSVTRFYEPSLKQFEFNPSKAKALLDEMGLKPGPNGVRASVEMIPNPYAEVWSRLSEYIRQALHVVGIEVRIKPTDAPGYVQAVGGHNFEISTAFMYQFADPALGVSRSYLTSNIRKGVMFTNTAQYSNATVDELFAKAATAASDAERQKHYTAIQRALVDDMPVVWLLELELPTFINKRFKSVVTGAHGVNASLDEAYLAP
jgi:peptide/nickel transport system substrate-binding protein